MTGCPAGAAKRAAGEGQHQAAGLAVAGQRREEADGAWTA